MQYIQLSTLSSIPWDGWYSCCALFLSTVALEVTADPLSPFLPVSWPVCRDALALWD